MDLDERELVQRCINREESACRDFVARYQALVFGVCARMLGDVHEAEDVSQETFVRALRSLKSWDSSRPMRAWLLAIAANRCRTQLGKRRRRPTPSEYTDDVPDVRKPAASANELHEAIQETLGSLREEYRQVFLLFHEQGLSYEEMSELVGRPVGTLKTWLHRARAELLTKLRSKGFALEVKHDVSGV